jgi:hypothetical protein
MNGGKPPPFATADSLSNALERGDCPAINPGVLLPTGADRGGISLPDQAGLSVEYGCAAELAQNDETAWAVYLVTPALKRDRFDCLHAE